MKILSAEQIRAVDEFTIANEPISSVDLMERAAMACTRKLMRILSEDRKVYVVCGKGNNGGDGLAIARMLMERGFEVKVFVVEHREQFSPDAKINYERFIEKYPDSIISIKDAENFKSAVVGSDAVLVEAIFGNGLNKPVQGLAAEIIDIINDTFKKIISIDIPAGLFADQSSTENKAIIRSAVTLTFQFPKLAFMMPENSAYVPAFEILDIGLHPIIVNLQPAIYYYITREDLLPLLKRRSKFDHKGTFGHALLLAGSRGKSGAALISARACLRSGAGLLTVRSDQSTLNALNQYLPEAMTESDKSNECITEIISPENYDAIGIGPGIGMHEETQQVLKKLLNYYTGYVVIDADGLNILSENKTWLNFLPQNAILTPHPKEFERLAGKQEDDFERLKTLKMFSMKHKCVVVLKGAHTAIAMPDGNVFFNSNGNPGLAKGGSGDALTGIILGLLARGYNAPQAALLGTFIHGYAADLCLKKMSMESLLVTDVIEVLPKAFRKMYE